MLDASRVAVILRWSVVAIALCAAIAGCGGDESRDGKADSGARPLNLVASDELCVFSEEQVSRALGTTVEVALRDPDQSVCSFGKRDPTAGSSVPGSLFPVSTSDPIVDVTTVVPELEANFIKDARDRAGEKAESHPEWGEDAFMLPDAGSVPGSPNPDLVFVTAYFRVDGRSRYVMVGVPQDRSDQAADLATDLIRELAG